MLINEGWTSDDVEFVTSIVDVYYMVCSKLTSQIVMQSSTSKQE